MHHYMFCQRYGSEIPGMNAAEEDIPVLKQITLDKKSGVVEASHKDIGNWLFSAEGATDLLFTNNETNISRLAGVPNIYALCKRRYQ